MLLMAGRYFMLRDFDNKWRLQIHQELAFEWLSCLGVFSIFQKSQNLGHQFPRKPIKGRDIQRYSDCFSTFEKKVFGISLYWIQYISI